MAKQAKRSFQIAIALPLVGVGFVFTIPLLVSMGLIPQPEKVPPASVGFSTADGVAIIAVFAGIGIGILSWLTGSIVCLFFGRPLYPSPETEAAWRRTWLWMLFFYLFVAILIVTFLSIV